MNKNPVGVLGYRPELDMLRAVAVLSVLLAHFWSEHGGIGQLGVRLFFVLSGFLITNILLDLRDGAEAAGGMRLGLLRNFFIRRALRIWPAYFLAFGAALFFDLQQIRAVAGWHFLFMSNILFAIRDQHLPWATSAWWSLAVEEQFYLFWPAVICLPPRKLLPWIVGALIYLGVLWHFAMEYFGITGLGAYYLPPAAFAALGSGSALALLRRHYGMVPRIVEYAGWAVTPLVAMLSMLQWLGWYWAVLSVLPMLALVSWGSRGGSRGLIGAMVQWKPVLWIGRVSFGIYLYHLFVMALLFSLIPWVPAFNHRGPVLFAAGATLSIAWASVSWLLLEAPLNRLKRYFPYREPVFAGKQHAVSTRELAHADTSARYTTTH